MKYSIIIPVFNSEKHIERCLLSIIANNFDDYEVIIVDDGSIDRTAALCETIIREHNTIKYVRKENGGASSARNVGIKQSKGDYILFVDSDDEVNQSYFKHLDKILEADKETDMILFNIDPESTLAKTKPAFTKHELYKALISYEYNAPWNKCYLGSIIRDQNIVFDEQVVFGEDLLFFIQYYAYVNHPHALYEHIYIQHMNPESITNSKLKFDELADLDKVFRTLIEVCETKEDEDIVINKAFSILLNRYVRLIDQVNDKHKVQDEFMKYQTVKAVFEYQNLSTVNQVKKTLVTIGLGGLLKKVLKG
ncbi:hypothetical protein AOC36_08490 [Erysipelothrix larvae]|uniref:Glycosyltransferase 2-like domain-containing protein n=1 Tax=Erysipelothrix larvae TaxID=1514105 RepID=A0A109UHB3_9FIRM|nr:glycosyltransferase family 2 protein [Erysipelothrix larvae]AMC94022.1 hypothetical protein AOC36_08490 [Erysipelothrix larvae]